MPSAHRDGKYCRVLSVTIFVAEPSQGFAEYIAAKEAGEAVCARLERELPMLRVVVNRLPRMSTDQTASLLPQAAKPALPGIERVLRQMQALGERR